MRPIATGLYGGYLTFVASIGAIGFCTAIIGDVAGHLGCFIFLKDSVNAIDFVALGTSVPGNPLFDLEKKTRGVHVQVEKNNLTR